MCAVNVNKENNRMYLHETQMIKQAGTSRSTRAIAESNPPSGYVPPIYSIFDKLQGVNDGNTRFQLKEAVEETKELMINSNLR